MTGAKGYFRNDPSAWPEYYAENPLKWRADLDNAMDEYLQACRQGLIARTQGWPAIADKLAKFEAKAADLYITIWNALPGVNGN